MPTEFLGMLHYAKYSAEIVGLFCNIVGLFCHIVGLFATEFSGMLQSLHLDLRLRCSHKAEPPHSCDRTGFRVQAFEFSLGSRI